MSLFEGPSNIELSEAPLGPGRAGIPIILSIGFLIAQQFKQPQVRDPEAVNYHWPANVPKTAMRIVSATEFVKRNTTGSELHRSGE